MPGIRHGVAAWLLGGFFALMATGLLAAEPEAATAPVGISPPGGTYGAGETVPVHLSHEDPDAMIRYTLDGTIPARNHGHVFTMDEPVSLAPSNKPITVKAKAWSAESGSESVVAQATFAWEAATPVKEKPRPSADVIDSNRSQKDAEASGSTVSAASDELQDAPTAFRPTAQTFRSITLSWTAPARWQPPSSAAFIDSNYYELQYKGAGFSSWVNAGSPSSPFATVYDLSADTEYQFRLCAVSRRGISTGPYTYNTAYFRSGYVEISAATATPFPPEAFYVTTRTARSVALAWTSPANTTTQQLQYKKADASVWSDSGNLASGTASTTVFNLDENTLYQFRLRVLHEYYFSGGTYHHVWSDWVATTAVTTTRNGARGPDTPTNFRCRAENITSATLRWEASAGATGYEIRYRKSSSTAWTTAVRLSAPAAAYMASGLDVNTSYDFVLTAFDARDFSGNTPVVTLVTSTAQVHALTNTVPVDDSTRDSLGTHLSKFYSFTVPSDATLVTIKTMNQPANVLDLIVNGPSYPQFPLTAALAESGRQGVGGNGNETVTFSGGDVKAGVYRIAVLPFGRTSGGNYTIVATHNGSNISAAPTLSRNGGTFASGAVVKVTLKSATAAARIRYTTDGSTPTASKGTLAPVTGIVTLPNKTVILRAVAYKSGFTTSRVLVSKPFTRKMVAPTLSKNGGTFTSGTIVKVVVKTASAGAALRYTTNGSTPTATLGTKVANGATITVPNKTLIIKAVACLGTAKSTVLTSLAFIRKVAAPTLTPAGGTFKKTATVTTVVKCGSPGATIRYTLDGSTPTKTKGTIIASGKAITLPKKTVTLKALAYKIGAVSSTVVAKKFTRS